MTNRPLVSVVVPTFNRAHLIREAVDSVLAQTYDHVELIVIDDGSTDDTLAVLGGYADPRLRLIHQENRGKSGARNRGLDEARGDYIAFLDSDDLWGPTFLNTLLQVAEAEPDVDLVFCDFQRFDAEGSEYSPQSEFLPELAHLKARAAAGGIGRVFLDRPFVAFVPMDGFATWLQTVLIRTGVARSIRFEPQVPLGQDFRYMLRVWAAARRAAYVGQVLAFVRRHEGNSYFAGEHLYPTVQFLEAIGADFPGPAYRRALDVKLGMQWRSIGHHHFWRGETMLSARAYLRALRFPGGKANSLAHLLSLPISLWRKTDRGVISRSSSAP